MPTTAESSLKKAVTGLSYVSETDAPFEAFLWQNAGEKSAKEAVLARAGRAKARPVNELSVDEFFQDLTQQQDWHGDEEKAAVAKYRNLVKVIQEQLADAKVFKIGAPQVDIYVVGKTKQGDWAGVKTKAVET
jgi:hypothetical protein